MKIQNFIQEYMRMDCASFSQSISDRTNDVSAKQADFDKVSFQSVETISADETFFARSLAHGITEDVCREKGVSSERVSQLQREGKEGTYQPDPMAIARAMYDL